jgi:hypothetical protein
MPIPLARDAHFDVPLSNFAVSAFNTDDAQYVGMQLMPEVPVGKQSDKYYVIERGAFQRVPATIRARGTHARRVQFTVTSGSYYANNYALATETPLEDLANADNAIQLRENNTVLLVNGLKLDQERRIANLVCSITNVGSGYQPSGTTKWNNANSDPVAQVNTGHAFIRQRTGLKANVALIDFDTLQVVRRHPLLLDLYKYTSGGELADAQIAGLFKVQRLLVAQAVVENQIEGTAASSMTNVWGNRLILAHVGAATGLKSTTFGVRFRWTDPVYPAAFGVQTAVENQAGQKKVEVQEAGYYQDERIVAPELAYTIDGTL